MIVFIYMNYYEKYKGGAYAPVKISLEEISGERCLVTYFNDIKEGEIESLKPTAIIWGGGTVPYIDNHDIINNIAIKKIMDNENIPQLAICYSHQLVSRIYGGTVELIGELDEFEPDIRPERTPGCKKEFGIYPVKVHEKDELFSNLPDTINVFLSHSFNIGELPREFKVLASSELCPIQSYRRVGRPFWGTQFHPEKVEVKDQYPHGTLFLTNFFEYAKNFIPKKEIRQSAI